MGFPENASRPLRPTKSRQLREAKQSRAARSALLLLLLVSTLTSTVTYAQDGSQPPTGEAPLVVDELPSEPGEVPAPHPDADKVVYIARVTIESDEDLAKLRDLGHSCAEADPCEIEATEAQVSWIQEAGLAVDVVGIVAEWSQGDALALSYRYGENMTDYNIPQGSASASTIVISGAPAGSKVGQVRYDCRVVASGIGGGPGDYRLNIRPGLSGSGYDVWYRLGGYTDGGHDDDAADDRDIYLYHRNIYSALDGHTVNQVWTFTAQDYVFDVLGSGKIDYWKLWVYYCPSDPTAPTLQVPFDSAHICDTTPSFDWVSVLNATSYNIAVDDSSSFSSPAIYTQVSSSNFTTPGSQALARKTWYWRVRAHNDCTWGPWSSSRRFIIDSQPAATTLLQPAYDSHTCDSTPTFHWTTASGATTYGIQVDDSATFSTPVVDNIVGSTLFTPAAPLPPGYYFWRVRGRSACGDGPWTSGRFYIDPPLAAPSSPSPANGATGVTTGANLDWINVPDATSYDVYFGTAASPPFVANVANSAYNLPALSASTKYYWKIVAKKGSCSTSGPVWNFTTGSGANQAPYNGTINPNSGAAPAGTIQYFTTTCFDPDGHADLKACRFHIGRNGAPKSLAGNAVLVYNPGNNRVRIRNDSGTKWWGGKLVGSNNVVQNGQAKVYCNLTTVTKVGNKVEVTWAVEFKPAFVGLTKMYLKARDLAGLTSPLKKKGTWTVQ